MNSHIEICRITKVSLNTLRSYLREFQSGGVEGLKRFESGGKISHLDQFTDQMCDYFVDHPPHTLREAQTAIEQVTGIKRSLTQVRKFLLRCGFDRRKVGSLPSKADPEEQERFKKNSCCPA